MPENEEIIEGEAPVTPEAPQVDPGAEAIKNLTARLEAQALEIENLKKPKEPEGEKFVLPKEYSPDAIQRMIDAGVEAKLQPISELVATRDRERNIEQRDSFIGLLGGLTVEETSALQAKAQHQFDTGGAASMEEAVNNAKAILGLKSTPNSQADDARRAGRRGAPSRASTQAAEELTEDEWLAQNVPD